MIISHESRSQLSRRGRAALWALGAALLSLGLFNLGTTAAQVQPVKEKPSVQKVNEKKGTQEIKAKPGADFVKEKAGAEYIKEKPTAKQSCEEMAVKIKAAMAAGTLSEDEGKARLEKCATEVRAAEVEIKKAVEVEGGVLSMEQAKEKLAAMQEGRAKGEAADQAKIERAAQEIRAAVAAGVITEEQGKEKLEALKSSASKPIANKTATGYTAADCEKIARAIAEAVAAGIVTLEQGMEKYPPACRK